MLGAFSAYFLIPTVSFFEANKLEKTLTIYVCTVLRSWSRQSSTGNTDVID